MKITLTPEELIDTLRKHYPVPSGYVVEDVEFRKHSVDFCTVSFVPNLTTNQTANGEQA